MPCTAVKSALTLKKPLARRARGRYLRLPQRQFDANRRELLIPEAGFVGPNSPPIGWCKGLAKKVKFGVDQGERDRYLPALPVDGKSRQVQFKYSFLTVENWELTTAKEVVTSGATLMEIMSSLLRLK